MHDNPYKSPADETPGRWSVSGWRRACLIGLSITVLSALGLWSAGRFHGGGATFDSAWLALFLLGMALLGLIVSAVSGIGWAIAARLRKR